MDWILNLLSKEANEKFIIVSNLVKYFFGSLPAFIIYSYFFGDYEFISLNWINILKFINSKFFYYSLISLVFSWGLYYFINGLHNFIIKKTSAFLFERLRKIVLREISENSEKNHFKFRRVLRTIGFLKKKNNKFISTNKYNKLKTTLEENKDIHLYYLDLTMSYCSVVVFIILLSFYYIKSFTIIIPFVLLYFYLFILALIISFLSKSSNMLLATNRKCYTLK